MPIYVDEVIWLMMRSRFLLDGGRTILFAYPSCADVVAAPPPWFFIPFRAAHAWLYAGLDTPLRIRLTGVGMAVAVFGVLLYLLRRMLPAPVATWRLAAIMAAFANLGVLPFLLALDRPEPQLLAAAGLLLLLPLARNGSAPRAAWRSPMAAGVALAVSAAMLSMHPKALFFLPLMAVAAWYLVADRRWAVVTLGLLLMLTWASYGDWQVRMACPNDDHMRAIMEQHSLSPALLADPVAFLGALVRNQMGGYHPLSYFSAILFQQRYMSDWLPPGQWLGWWSRIANGLLIGVIGGLSLMFGVAMIRRAGLAWRRLTLERELCLLLALLASLACLTVFQVIKNAYEASLVVPLFGLAVMVAVQRDLGPLWTRLRRSGGTVVMVVSLVSQATLWTVFVPQAVAGWTSGGYLSAQSESVSAFAYASVAPRVLATARHCGIEAKSSAVHLVVDPLTYPALAQTREPTLIGYLTGGYGQGIHDLEGLLANLGSAGAVVGCHLLPPDLRGRAVQHGEFCCLPAFTPSAFTQSTFTRRQ